jgi:hypothetical protein
MSKTDNIVDSHRKMLMVSKNLSDFQIENLRNWPFLFFTTVESVSVEWNFIDDNDLFYEGEVSFDVKTSDTNDLGVAVMYLEASTKVMFWTDTKVSVKINGELWKKTKTSSNTKKISTPKKTKASKPSSKVDAQA